MFTPSLKRRLFPGLPALIATNAPEALDDADTEALGIPFYLPHGMLRIVVTSGEAAEGQATTYEDAGFVALVADDLDGLYVASAVRWGGRDDD
jgi:hypothetical protein